MPATEFQEIAALALVFVVHLVAAVLLVWPLLSEDTRSGWRRRWRPGPPGPGGDDPQQPPPAPRPSPAFDRPPLPDFAEPSPVRLRGPGRLGDAHPSAPRRPDHAPQPARTPR